VTIVTRRRSVALPSAATIAHFASVFAIAAVAIAPAQVRGVLPLLHKKGLVSDARVRSLPVFPAGGPLGDSHADEVALIEAAREEQFDLASLSLRVGILGSEMWSDELRARIEKELRIRTFDIIGMTETGGPGLGIDCAARRGIHVWEDHYHPEVVDPASGAVVPDGTEGELVVSTLTREGLPLVRYRTHDLTRVISRARCDCGRTSLRIDRLRGRVDDMVIYKGVNFYPRQIETTLLRHSGVSHEYQIVLDSEGGGERMTIRVEAEPGCDPAVATRIRRELYDLLSLSPEVRLCTHGEIERPQGKAVRVVDRRPRR